MIKILNFAAVGAVGLRDGRFLGAKGPLGAVEGVGWLAGVVFRVRCPCATASAGSTRSGSLCCPGRG